MARDIMFRAWDKERGIMVDSPYFFDKYHFSDENRINKWEWRYYGDWRDLEDGRGRECELMQFTGCNDKTGKPIYEGDIVKRVIITFDLEKPDGEDEIRTEEISYIEWRHSGFWVAAEHFGWEGESMWHWGDIEVIGNIYENGDLLGKD
jgi:uncharacterized phage protein (TIGR01671 family)